MSSDSVQPASPSWDEFDVVFRKEYEMILGVPFTAEVAPDVRLADLGMDSLDQLELLTAVEGHVGRQISDDLFAKLQTLGDVYEFITGSSLRQ